MRDAETPSGDGGTADAGTDTDSEREQDPRTQGDAVENENAAVPTGSLPSADASNDRIGIRSLAAEHARTVPVPPESPTASAGTDGLDVEVGNASTGRAVRADDSADNDNSNNDVDVDVDDLTVKTLPIDLDETAPADVELPPQEYHRNGGFGFAMFYDHHDMDDDHNNGIVLRSHICCGILCDCRRACLMIDTISLISSFIALVAYVLAVLDGRFIDESTQTGADDDAYVSADRATQIIVVCVYVLSLVCYAIGIAGAIGYNFVLVSVASCRYIVEAVAAGILQNYATLVLALLFLYPHVVIAYEFWHGIVTPVSYPYQEYSCCCRTNSATIAMEMERRHRRQRLGRRQRSRQR